jgi:DNA-binding NarL/FixJ family response regulator
MVLDDHPLFSTVLMLALRANGMDARCGDLLGSDAVLGQVDRLPPGLVLLDLHYGRSGQAGRVDGPELIRAFSARQWAVLVLTDHGDDAQIAAAIAAGAAGAVAKSASMEDLLATVLTAAAGLPVMTDLTREGWLRLHRGHLAHERQWAARFGRLSTREREVLTLLVQGQRAAAIAEHFVVEMTTVRTQIRAVLAKLEVSSQMEAVALATQPR